jgi:hypothetical protein
MATAMTAIVTTQGIGRFPNMFFICVCGLLSRLAREEV